MRFDAKVAWYTLSSVSRSCTLYSVCEYAIMALLELGIVREVDSTKMQFRPKKTEDEGKCGQWSSIGKLEGKECP